MKVIAIGDIHIKEDALPDINELEKKVCELIKKENPDFVVIMGDILNDHERIHTVCLNKAYDFIRNVRDLAETHILVGNHDTITNNEFLNENHWMNGLKEWKNVFIYDTVVVRKMEGKKIVFSPYVFAGRFEEALSTVDWKDADCIFCHQEIQGCKFGYMISVAGDKWELDYPFIVSGHIHNHQTPQPNVYYTGSSRQVAYGESEKNIIPIVHFDETDSYPTIEEIDLNLPRKHIVYRTLDDVENFEVGEDNKDNIKLTVTGDYDQFKSFKKTTKFKDLKSKGVKVVFKSKKKNDDHKIFKNENGSEKDFKTILSTLVLFEKNPKLSSLYELVVNNNQVSEKDFMFM